MYIIGRKNLFSFSFLASKKFIYLFFFLKCDDCANHFCGFRHQLLFFFCLLLFIYLFFFFSPFSSFFFVFSLYLPLLYRLASSCLSNMHVFFFLVSLPYSSVSFLGIAFSVFLVVLCFPLSSFFFSLFFSFSSCSGDVGGKVCVRFFFFKVRNRE